MALRSLGRNTLHRRLFAWLAGLTVMPALLVLLVSAWLWSGALAWFGTLGPWEQLTESGRVLFDAAGPHAAEDSALAAAVAGHREALSSSAVLARRWAFVGERLASQLPTIVLAFAVVLSGVALLVSRRLARGLARPIEEVAAWTAMLAREEPIPPAEARDTVEVRALRAAVRDASAELAAARVRALEAERVRVWGEMARRVAHEMKNPLTPLRLAVHRLESDGTAAAEALAVVKEETARLEELARQFSWLGRPPEGVPSAVDLRELLERLLATDVPPGFDASLEAAADVPPVEAHYEALVRAFRNILRNAVEALEEVEGPRRIRVSVARAREPGMVEIRFADSGPGLPPELGDRIFEPDCTTKWRGTGLGLAVVRHSVTATGGRITAGNRPEGGAEFVILLPEAVTPLEGAGVRDPAEGGGDPDAPGPPERVPAGRIPPTEEGGRS